MYINMHIEIIVALVISVYFAFCFRNKFLCFSCFFSFIATSSIQFGGDLGVAFAECQVIPLNHYLIASTFFSLSLLFCSEIENLHFGKHEFRLNLSVLYQISLKRNSSLQFSSDVDSCRFRARFMMKVL